LLEIGWELPPQRFVCSSRQLNKGVHIIPGDERLIIELPGGGGVCVSGHRDPQAVKQDIEEDLI
jgi:N-methylhydantoinase B/oxoprolinase/acetone carboxylase alpha subunit